MKVGVTLPQFRDSAEAALVAAQAADADERIEGIFAFDHLWAIGRPDHPSIALWPLLGAMAAATSRIAVGSLVARVSLMADALVAHQVAGVAAIAGADRVIVGLGAGDALSRDENNAYGVPFPPLADRLDSLERTAALVRDRGVEVWIGGRSAIVHDLARRLGLSLNLWESDLAETTVRVATGPVTWGGVVADHPEGPASLVASLRSAGVDWAVLAPAYRPDDDPRAAVKAIGDAIGEA